MQYKNELKLFGLPGQHKVDLIIYFFPCFVEDSLTIKDIVEIAK